MRQTGARRVLRRRIQSLDSVDRPWATSPGVDGLIEHTIATLAARTGDPDEAGTGPNAALDPAEADDIASRCATLTEIGRHRPDVVRGPLRRDAQQWIGTARHTRPDPAKFRPATATTTPNPKPFHLGLHTSTDGPDGRSGWRIYLEQLHLGSDLFPLPWNAWNLPVHPDARVREITSAQDWTRLIEDFALIHASNAYPDWTAIAADHDAVHLTLRAVVAIQGLPLHTAAGPTSPAFWDVESTLWLRWRFGPPRHRYTITDLSQHPQ